jgi:hypothetical protein
MSFPPPKNPSFMEETAYEPLVLNVPLLGRSAEGTSRDPGPGIDTVVAVEDEQPSLLEARQPMIEEDPPLKKRRTIRFVE